MDETAFDRFARAASRASSRRRLLGLATALPLAGLLHELAAEDGTAKRKRHGRRRGHRPGKHKDNRKGKRKGKSGGSGLGAANCDVCPSGCTFNSIQGAIEAASAGDTITICPDEYTEDLTISKNLTMAGFGEGAAVAGAGDSSVVTVLEGVTATIQAVAIGKGIGTPVGNVRFGGGIFNEGDLTLINLDLGENTAGSGGAIFNIGTLTLNKVLIAYNQADDQGGGIHSQGQVTIDNASEISNNEANEGGGIYNNGGDLTIRGGSIVGANSADSDGGGLYIDGGETIVDASFVQENTAKARGGGILNRGTITARNGAVINDNQAKNGGGVYNLGEPDGFQPVLTVADSAVSENNASEVGGGIFNDEGSVILQAGTMFNNKATATGGGIFSTDGGVVTVDAESAVVENTPNNCIGTTACAA